MSDYVLKHIVRSRGDGSVDNILSSPHSTTEIFIGIDGKHNNIGVDYVVAPNYNLKQVIDDMRKDLEDQGITTGILKVVLLEGNYVIPESSSYTNHLNFIFEGSNLNFSKVILEGRGDVTISGEMNILRCSVDFIMNNIKVIVTQSYTDDTRAAYSQVLPIELWGYFNQFNDVDVEVTAKNVWFTGSEPDDYYPSDEHLNNSGFSIIGLKSEGSNTELVSDTGLSKVLAKQTVFNRCKVTLNYSITANNIAGHAEGRCGGFVTSAQLPYAVGEDGYTDLYTYDYPPDIVFNNCVFDFCVLSLATVHDSTGSQLSLAKNYEAESQFNSCIFNLQGIRSGNSVAWACISEYGLGLLIRNCYINLESYGQVYNDSGYSNPLSLRALTDSTVVKFQETTNDCLNLKGLTSICGNLLVLRASMVSPVEIALSSNAIVTGNYFVNKTSDKCNITYMVSSDQHALIIKDNILLADSSSNISIEPASSGQVSSGFVIEDNLIEQIYPYSINLFKRGNKLTQWFDVNIGGQV